MNYYNEFDPKAAEWLRQLIWVGAIADGEVDTRSIEDVTPNDLDGFTQCHFFAGIGGWSLALRLAGWPDTQPVWTGSCPCQPFSAAGKGGGFADERHLWPAFYHLVQQQRPPVIFGEQVASPAGLTWFDLVQVDLEVAAYTTGAVDICAAGVGAPHIRQRLYWLADSARAGRRDRLDDTHHAGSQRLWQRWNGADQQSTWEASLVNCRDGKRRPVEPGTFPLAHGVPGRVGLLRGYGNAIVPQVAAEFIGAYLDVR